MLVPSLPEGMERDVCFSCRVGIEIGSKGRVLCALAVVVVQFWLVGEGAGAELSLQVQSSRKL